LPRFYGAYRTAYDTEVMSMALTWSVKNVKDWDDTCHIIATVDWPMDGTKKGDKLLNPVTSSLIWHSLSTGIGTITKANAAEVYARIALLEDLYGASLRNDEGEVRISMDDVTRHIGLQTNASFKDESRTSFLKRHAAAKLDDRVRGYNRHVEKQEVEALAETLAS
jgi:hypothetical protein